MKHLHAVIIERLGDPPQPVKRMLEFVRPGDVKWTFVFRDESGKEVVRHHDAIERWIDTGGKK